MNNADLTKANDFSYDFNDNFIESMTKVTQEYWDYIDFKHAKNRRQYPHMTLKNFMTRYCKINLTTAIEFIKRYNRHQKNLPTSGVLMFYKDLKTKDISFIVVQMNSVKMWSMPKGKHNNNESSIEAGGREFREETGIDTTDHMDDSTPSKVFNRTTFFIIESDCKIDVSNYKTREIGAVRWASTKDVLDNTFKGKYSKQVQMAAEFLQEEYKF